MSGLRGHCDPAFAPLRDELAAALDSGAETGVSLSVIVDDTDVVDLWGGVADPDTGRPWAEDTLVNTYSLTKTITATAALVLIDRGLLDPEAPVARYWPEFAAAGKESVLVRHVLGHTSGVAGWQDRMTIDDLLDVPAATARLAAQEPWWTPGEGSGYHAICFGNLVGELVRRIDGRTLGTFIAEELAAPLGADFHLGSGPEIDERVAPMIPPPPSGVDYGALDPDSALVKALANPVIPPALCTERRHLAAELGGMNGQSNARGIARLGRLISHGGTAGGHRLLSPATIATIFDVQADGVDRVLGAPLRFGLGFALPSPQAMPAVPDGRVCWWTGFGGSLVVNDLDRRMTFAYVMNRMDARLVGAPRSAGYLATTYRCVTR